VAASYGVTSADAATFDVLFGARLAHMKQELNWTFSGDFGPVTPPPMTGTRGTSVDQWDAVVGGKGRVMFGADHHWAMPYYFDIGTGDSDFTWQAVLVCRIRTGGETWASPGATWTMTWIRTHPSWT
jgi:hypothetical protein